MQVSRHEMQQRWQIIAVSSEQNQYLPRRRMYARRAWITHVPLLPHSHRTRPRISGLFHVTKIKLQFIFKPFDFVFVKHLWFMICRAKDIAKDRFLSTLIGCRTSLQRCVITIVQTKQKRRKRQRDQLRVLRLFFFFQYVVVYDWCWHLYVVFFFLTICRARRRCCDFQMCPLICATNFAEKQRWFRGRRPRCWSLW